MVALLAEMDDFRVLPYVCGGCALVSALFLVLVILSLVWGFRSQRPSDD